MAQSKTALTLEDRIARMEKLQAETRDRCLQLERAVRIIGREFEKTHLSEDNARRWAGRMRSLSNAMREVRSHLKKYGNEFDREPHFTDPEKDYQE